MLPGLATNIQKNEVFTMSLRGINYSDMLQEGDMVDSLNISARRYPYISTRKKRTVHGNYTNATALASWEKLIVVDGTNLYYDDQLLGTVTAGEKQFAMVNTKLVVMPDKKYYDFDSHEWIDMGSDPHENAKIYSESEQSIAVNFRGRFPAGTTIVITGNTVFDGEYTIINAEEVDYSHKEIGSGWSNATLFTIGSGGKATPQADIGTVAIKGVPDLDYICECENRLWGCSSADKTIYASALGMPEIFYDYRGVSTDSYAVAVGSAGEFTGICKFIRS